jgi:ACS family hexuronate transporter-like MFS transporter
MALETTTPSPTPALQNNGNPQKPTRFRWIICGLLFYATTVNYIDRSVLNALEPTLKDIIHWKPYQYGLINAAFSLAYAIGFILMGNIIDKVGTRLGYAFSILIWTLSALATVFTKTPFQFGLARFGLGIGEAGNFPAAIKTVAEWFPQKQRATATGIFNAGSNVGAILAPLLALLLVPLYGWRAAFLVTPLLATMWIFLWLYFYRTPADQPRANDAERAMIESDHVLTTGKPLKWRNILPHRQAWAFMAGKFLTDPIWWFYLFWSGAFFHDKFGVKLAGTALPLIYIYILADIGSIGGGHLSSTLIKKGWTPNFARKFAMSICALCILPVIGAPFVPATMHGGLWLAATLIGVAAAAHQGFSANIFTITSDMFPKRAVSSVTGLGGLAGALGSIIMQSISGVILQVTGSFLIMFVIAGSVYVFAVVAVHLLAPRLTRVTDEELDYTPMPRQVTSLVFAVLGFVVGVPLSFLFQSQSLTLATVSKNLGTTATTLSADTLHSLIAAAPKGFTFGEYIASIMPGDIFKSFDSSTLVPILVWTPIFCAIVGIVIGALLHGFIFPRRNKLRTVAA